MIYTYKTLLEAENKTNELENALLVINDTVFEVHTGEDVPISVVEPPKVIELPAHRAFIMLEKIGLLTQCQNICKAIGPDAEIALNKAPTIRSDNPLVHTVLEQTLGKTKEEIYQLFVTANDLPI